jgi:hypothetical protein
VQWEPLADFIRTEDPSFAASVQGVPLEEIERVERENGIRLPRSYRGFLQMMGRDSDGFDLFGPHRNHRFGDLVERLPARSYPGRSYFKIGLACDPSEISPPDYFLDLTRSDGLDAPIVMFEDDDELELEDFDPGRVRDTPFTFGEQATNRVFTFLVLDRSAETSRIIIGAQSREERRTVNSDVIALLRGMKFDAVLPADPLISTFRRGSLGVLVNVREDLRCVAVNLGGEEGPPVKVVVDQVLGRYPDAAVRGSGGPFGSGGPSRDTS